MSIAISGGTSFSSGTSLRLLRLQDIPNLEGWWDADYNVFEAAGDPAENGDNVFRWTSRDSSAREFNQSGAAGNRPTYSTGQINGLAALSFPSGNRFLENTTLPEGDGSSGYTAIFVANFTGASGSNRGLFSGGTTGGVLYPNSSGNIADDAFCNAVFTYTPTISISAWRVISFRTKTNLKTTYINNSIQTTQTSVTYKGTNYLSTTTKNIGNNFLTSWVGYIGSVVYFSRYIDDSELFLARDFFYEKYALTP